MKLFRWLIPLLLILPACGQNVRFDYTAETTTGTGQFVPILAIPGAPISFYTGCTSLPCSTKASTFTSASGSSCSATAQVTVPLSSTCVATADKQGNFGAWMTAGTYQYTITVSGVVYGPYQFTTGGGGGGSGNPSAPNGSIQFDINGSFGGQGGQLIATAFAGADIVAQINAAFTSCSLNCTVRIPAGTYTVASGTVSMTRNTQSLIGDGAGKVIINYAGTKFLDAHEDSTHFSSIQGGKVSGFTLIESNSAAIGLSLGSWVGLEVSDANIIGPGGFSNLNPPGTSQGIVFQNSTVTQANWFERWILRKVDIEGFAKNKHFMAPSGAGTNSFGYGSVISNTNNVGPGTIMDQVDVGANVYNQLQWTEQVNSVSTTTADEYYRIAGEFKGEGFHVTGENTAAPYTFAHILSTGHMNWSGDFRIFGNPPITVDANQSAGSELPFNIVTPSGSFYKTGGIPLLANFDGSGHSFSVVPLDFPDQDVNISARVGYLYDTTNGNSSIYDAFSTGTKRCMFVRGSSQNESSLVSEWCLDATGNTTQNASATNTTTNSTIEINTPLWVSANPIVQGTSAIGNIFSVQDNFGATKMFGDHSGVWHSGSFQLTSGFLACSVGNAGLVLYQHFGGSTPDALTGCVDTTGGGSYSPVSLLNSGGGGSGITGLTAGHVPLAGSSTTLTGNSHLDEVTNAGEDTFTQPVVAPSYISGTPSAGALAALPSGANGAAFDETTTAGVPAAGVDYIRADATTHKLVQSVNGGAETAIGSGSVTFPWSCQPGLGDGTNAITGATYLQTSCYNDTGQTVTLTHIRCFTDNNGTSSLAATNGAGTALLTGAVTCTNAFAAGTQSATVTIAAGDFIKFTFVEDGTTKQTTAVVTGTHP